MQTKITLQNLLDRGFINATHPEENDHSCYYLFIKNELVSQAIEMELGGYYASTRSDFLSPDGINQNFIETVEYLDRYIEQAKTILLATHT